MPRVLLPSDNHDFVRYLAQAYRRAGWEAVVGASNFDLAAASYDLVHLQWPEELCGWHPPGEARLAEVIAQLEAWCRTTKVAMTVHNLQPHRDAEHPSYRRLYEAFFARVPVLAHFTDTSRELALREYPASRAARHIVTGFFNLDHLLPEPRDAAATRRAAGFREEDFVVLIIGGLREWAEVELLRAAFDRARVPRKRLLMAARYDEAGSRWRQRWRRWILMNWLKARRANVWTKFIPDAELHRAVDAADAIVIPRFRSLNSGLPALGASFGKIIIAPRCGAYPELLAGTLNPIYAPGDADALARALEAAAQLDRRTVAAENAKLAATWRWETIVQRVVATL